MNAPQRTHLLRAVRISIRVVGLARTQAHGNSRWILNSFTAILITWALTRTESSLHDLATISLLRAGCSSPGLCSSGAFLANHLSERRLKNVDIPSGVRCNVKPHRSVITLRPFGVLCEPDRRRCSHPWLFRFGDRSDRSTKVLGASPLHLADHKSRVSRNDEIEFSGPTTPVAFEHVKNTSLIFQRYAPLSKYESSI